MNSTANSAQTVQSTSLSKVAPTVVEPVAEHLDRVRDQEDQGQDGQRPFGAVLPRGDARAFGALVGALGVATEDRDGPPGTAADVAHAVLQVDVTHFGDRWYLDSDGTPS